jgi:hypothetical protein
MCSSELLHFIALLQAPHSISLLLVPAGPATSSLGDSPAAVAAGCGAQLERTAGTGGKPAAFAPDYSPIILPLSDCMAP